MRRIVPPPSGEGNAHVPACSCAVLSRVLRVSLLLVVWACPALAQVYRWVDSHGEPHFTDDRASIPKGAKVETTDGDELTEVSSDPLPTPGRPKAGPAPRPSARPSPTTQTGPVEVTVTKVEVEVSDADLEFIKAEVAKAAASPAIARWGPLRRSVEVHVVPLSKLSVDAFGQAHGATVMELRAPRDAAVCGRPLPYDVVARHELAHLIEHQTAGQLRPRWFAEGFAQYVASPTDPMSAIEDVAWWVIQEGGDRPLETVFPRVRTGRETIAYAVALAGVAFFVEQVGEAGLRRSLELREQGQSFQAAMESVLGCSLLEFQKRFKESLRPHFYERARAP